MSMRGEIISGEYKSMVWVHDESGRQYACYARDLNNNKSNGEHITQEEKKNCLDLSQVLGDSW